MIRRLCDDDVGDEQGGLVKHERQCRRRFGKARTPKVTTWYDFYLRQRGGSYVIVFFLSFVLSVCKRDN